MPADEDDRPLTNDDFRRLLATPRPDVGPEDRPRKGKGGGRRPKPPAPVPQDQAKDDGTGYRDRAAERRRGLPGHEDAPSDLLLGLPGLGGSMAPSTAATAFQEDMGAVGADGDDVPDLPPVKGLDYDLLQRVREDQGAMGVGRGGETSTSSPAPPPPRPGRERRSRWGDASPRPGPTGAPAAGARGRRAEGGAESGEARGRGAAPGPKPASQLATLKGNAAAIVAAARTERGRTGGAAARSRAVTALLVPWRTIISLDAVGSAKHAEVPAEPGLAPFPEARRLPTTQTRAAADCPAPVERAPAGLPSALLRRLSRALGFLAASHGRRGAGGGAAGGREPEGAGRAAVRGREARDDGGLVLRVRKLELLREGGGGRAETRATVASPSAAPAAADVALPPARGPTAPGTAGPAPPDDPASTDSEEDDELFPGEDGSEYVPTGRKPGSADVPGAAPSVGPAAVAGAYPDTDAAYPDTDAAYPDTDAAYPDTDAAYPDTDAAYPDTDAAYPDTDAAYPDTDAAYPTAGPGRTDLAGSSDGPGDTSRASARDVRRLFPSSAALAPPPATAKPNLRLPTADGDDAYAELYPNYVPTSLEIGDSDDEGGDDEAKVGARGRASARAAASTEEAKEALQLGQIKAMFESKGFGNESAFEERKETEVKGGTATRGKRRRMQLG